MASSVEEEDEDDRLLLEASLQYERIDGLDSTDDSPLNSGDNLFPDNIFLEASLSFEDGKNPATCRFPMISDEDMERAVESTRSSKTTSQTSWAYNVWSAWRPREIGSEWLGQVMINLRNLLKCLTMNYVSG